MKPKIKPTKFNALKALAPNSKFVMDGDGTITNHTLKGGDTLPSESEIDTKLNVFCCKVSQKDNFFLKNALANRGVQALRKLRFFVEHAKNNWVKS